MAIIESDQQYETPVTTYRRGGFAVRYAYSRSSDAQEVKIPGEDYFVFKVASERIVFALSDGVGSSFMGNIGAQIVAETALDWLWATADTSTQKVIDSVWINENLSKWLNKKINFASSLLMSINLEGEYNEKVYQAFRKKRDESGTQANLVCGMIELPSQKNLLLGRVWLAGLGDAHLRCWSNDHEITANNLIGIYSPGMGWSSKSGVIGKINSYCTSIENLDKVLLYSDGLNPAHEFLKPGIPSKTINEVIEKIQSTPDSDDISFLEISVDPSALSKDIVETMQKIRSSTSLSFSNQEDKEMLSDTGNENLSVENKERVIETASQKRTNFIGLTTDHLFSIIAVIFVVATTGFVFGYYFLKILFNTLLK